MLGVHKSAANNAVRAELGIFPFATFCLKSCVNYWLHVIELIENNFVYYAYSDEISDTGFSDKIKLFLEKISFSNVRANQSKKISNDQELIQSDPISCPQNQKGNN